MKSEWRVWSLALAAALVLAGCVVAPPDPYEDERYYAVPPPRVESRGYPPVAGYLWFDGYWMWGVRGHEWAPGYWVSPYEYSRALALRRQHEQQRELMIARERARAQEARARDHEREHRRAQELERERQREGVRDRDAARERDRIPEQPRERTQPREWMQPRDRTQDREREQDTQRLRERDPEREHHAVQPQQTWPVVRPGSGGERYGSRDPQPRREGMQERDPSPRLHEQTQRSAQVGSSRPPAAVQPEEDADRQSEREHRRQRPRTDRAEWGERWRQPDQR